MRQTASLQSHAKSVVRFIPVHELNRLENMVSSVNGLEMIHGLHQITPPNVP